VHRFPLALASLLVFSAFAPAPAAHAEPIALKDSTVFDSWRLPNGLEVRVRTIPGAVGASVSMAYRAGALHMPEGHGATARLLAELQFTAATGNVPERSRDELPVLRPDGWDIRGNDHVEVLTEVANRQQLAGVLLQVASRAHGVQPSDSCFLRALATVRTMGARERLGQADLVLHYRLRDVALGKDDARIFADAQGRELTGIDRAAATQLLQRLYVPSNATLALAGDFGGVDLHALVEHLFADIPAGKPEPERVAPVLKPGSRISMLNGLTLPVGVVGVIAPAVEDTMHAPFYLASLLAGSWWHDKMGPPRPPLSAIFHYSVLDEPDLVRFYLQPAPDLTDTTVMVARWGDQIDALRAQQFMLNVLNDARMSVDWLLGGLISTPVRKLMRRDISPLPELSASMATQASWKGDAFWADWRRRFETSMFAPQMFLNYMLDPGHQTSLLLTPRR
jgi:hypothetical protein